MTATFTTLDYCLFVGVLLVSALIGVFYMVKERRQKESASAEDLLMGGRRLSVLPVAMSLLASYMSAITVLGIPTEIYTYGTGYWLVTFSGVIMFPIACFVFLPFFHNLQLDSAYQYLELRFNRTTRYLASVLFVVEMLLYLAVVLYAPSLALNQVTGLSVSASILAVGAVVTFYTSMGGLRAVVWTDTFQTCVVMLGLIGIIVMGTQRVGGMATVWAIAQRGNRIDFFNFDPSPFTRMTVWSAVIGSVIGQLTIYGASPTMLQRYMSIRDVRGSQIALLVSLPATVLLVTLVCLSGLVIYATYHDCDPLLSGDLVSKDQILPYFVMDQLGAMNGAPGLFVSCIFAASLSSVSSVLNALSITILEDLVKPWIQARGSELSASAQATLAKILGVCSGMAVIGLAFLSSALGNTVLEIMITALGIGGGPLLGLFIMGMFLPCVNSTGAIVGFAVSTVCTFWVAIGAIVLHVVQPSLPFSTEGCAAVEINASAAFSGYNTIQNLLQEPSSLGITSLPPADNLMEWTGLNRIYTLSFLWYPTLALVVAVVVGILVSAVSGWRRDTLAPRLVYNVGENCCRCLPHFLAKVLGCAHMWKYKVRGAQDFPSDEDDSEEENDFYMDDPGLQPLTSIHDKAAYEGFLRNTHTCFEPALDSEV